MWQAMAAQGAAQGDSDASTLATSVSGTWGPTFNGQIPVPTLPQGFGGLSPAELLLLALIGLVFLKVMR